jgi:hypothetical protein
MILKTINGVEYLCIPLDDIRNLKVKPEVLDTPTWEAFKEYALDNKPNIDIDALRIKYRAWKENRWADGNGKKIKNWKAKLLNTLPYIKEGQMATGRVINSERAPKGYGVPSPTAVPMPESLKKRISKIGKA